VRLASYNARRAKDAVAILKRLGTPCLIHELSYSMINRWIEDGLLLDTLEAEGVGAIVFSPLAQGLLTDKYLDGVPEDGRATVSHFSIERCSRRRMSGARVISMRSPSGAARRSLRWRRRGRSGTSERPRAHRRKPPPERIADSVKALETRAFTADELNGDRPLRSRGRRQSVAAIRRARSIAAIVRCRLRRPT
jgi:L-glyceraldehyde 3-phosphate reductase